MVSAVRWARARLGEDFRTGTRDPANIRTLPPSAYPDTGAHPAPFARPPDKVTPGKEDMAGKFELFTDEDSNVRFRMIGPDGSVLALSRAFPDTRSAAAGVAAMRECAGTGLISNLCAGGQGAAQGAQISQGSQSSQNGQRSLLVHGSPPAQGAPGAHKAPAARRPAQASRRPVLAGGPQAG